MPAQATLVPHIEDWKHTGSILAIPQTPRQQQSIAVTASKAVPVTAPRGANWFSEALLEMSPTRPKRQTKDVFVSVMLHSLILTAALLGPLYFSETIDLKQFTRTLLVAPPPPPPPPPPAQPIMKSVPTHARMITATGKLLAPTVIPKNIVLVKEDPLPPDMTSGIEGGVEGGVPGGQMGGVIGGIISNTGRTNVPPPISTVARPKAPVRIGGKVKPPRCIQKIEPVYPALARQVHVQGEVRIEAVLDTNGDVVEMHAVSGPPLLIQAALDAVKKWKYEPTYLNGEPVAVEMYVTVTFQLAQ